MVTTGKLQVPGAGSELYMLHIIANLSHPIFKWGN